DPSYRPRSGRAQGTCARIQGRAGGGDVVHQQDRCAFETSSAPAECVFYVLEAPQPVAADLRRCRTRTYEFSFGRWERHALPKLRGQQLRLVVSALAQAGGMQRNRDHAARRKAFDREPFGDELSERTGKTPPALVFEPMHRVLDRPLVSDRGAKPRERRQPRAAAAFASCRFNLDPAMSTQRLLEPPDPRPAPIAKPGADFAARAAARRKNQIEHVHQTSVWMRSTCS